MHTAWKDGNTKFFSESAALAVQLPPTVPLMSGANKPFKSE